MSNKILVLYFSIQNPSNDKTNRKLYWLFLLLYGRHWYHDQNVGVNWRSYGCYYQICQTHWVENIVDMLLISQQQKNMMNFQKNHFAWWLHSQEKCSVSEDKTENFCKLHVKELFWLFTMIRTKHIHKNCLIGIILFCPKIWNFSSLLWQHIKMSLLYHLSLACWNY